MRTWGHSAGLALIVVATVATTACAHVRAATDGLGTVQGRLLLVGGPAPGLPRPATGGTVTLQGHGTARGAVDAQGHFRVEIRPGSYVVTATTPEYGSGRYLCRANHQVDVTATHMSRVNVYCQLS